ncbi:unnamed protein product [Blepharisma stoltei]|uniref:Protein kinase domain-containing protein n=1 Tax=Blepharisma stoltei TaxID=1481888 RepID=A0AAU9IBR8_9CILI|nr:unnamed protein product [Blepharisma stoltei]
MVDLLISIDEISKTYGKVRGDSANELIRKNSSSSYSDLINLYNGLIQDSENNPNVDLWKLWRACYANAILTLPFVKENSENPSFNSKLAPQAFEHLLYLATQYNQPFPKANERLVSRISEAINNAESIEEMIEWARLAKDISKQLGTGIDYVINLISIKSKTEFYKNSSSDNKDIILKNLENLLELKNLEISGDDVQNIVVDYALAWIDDVNDLKKFKEFRGEKVNPDPDTSRKMLRVIKKLELSEEKYQEKIKNLDEIFPDQYVPAVEEIKELDEPSPALITHRSQIVMGNAIFKHNDISVYECKLNWYGQEIIAAIKTYKEDKNSNKYRERFKKEVEILSMTSGRGWFFLDYYGSFIDKVIENNTEKFCYSVLMEYCPNSLADIIKARKSKGLIFSEEELYKICLDLLEAFKSLVNLRIYHRDIKPDNILVSKDGQLKIGDFNISGVVEVIENTCMPTEEHDVLGTTSFMAPELKKAWINGKSVEKYRPERSDVFSLGLVFYLCATFKSISRFNDDKNNREKVRKDVKLPWLQKLIYEMLDFEYKKRPSFRRILKHMKRYSTEPLS